MTSRRPTRAAASSAGARGRTHSTLAPEHLGEAAAAATVAVVVGGIALAITGVGMLVMALTLGSRYAGDPPPNLGSLMVGPAIGGVPILLLGSGLTVGGVAVLGEARRARLVTGILSVIAAALAALGTLLVMTNLPADPVLAVALTVAVLVFGVAALLLLRPTR